MVPASVLMPAPYAVERQVAKSSRLRPGTDPLRPSVHGRDLDAQTRCAHWHSALDIIAIKMRCCGVYYACRECHDEMAGHAAAVWTVEEFGELAILCGACGTELSVTTYLGCNSRCPRCAAAFNPGCHTHRHLYFET
jgi:uncharacterized CHY-type Zn-finger protein